VTTDQPYALAADSSGKFLYAIDSNLSDAIEGFSIDADTGGLTATMGSPFSTPSPPNSLALDPSGKFIYATVNATTLADSMILGFAIDASNGSLSALATSPYPAPPFPVNVVSLNVP
jgi:6-phosphogluconolactonase